MICRMLASLSDLTWFKIISIVILRSNHVTTNIVLKPATSKQTETFPRTHLLLINYLVYSHVNKWRTGVYFGRTILDRFDSRHRSAGQGKITTNANYIVSLQKTLKLPFVKEHKSTTLLICPIWRSCQSWTRKLWTNTTLLPMHYELKTQLYLLWLKF